MSVQQPQRSGSNRGHRPVSEAVPHAGYAHSQSANALVATSSSRAPQRASHAIDAMPLGPPSASANNSNNSDSLPGAPYDVNSHPKAIAYQQAHPRRALPKFGPYLLLQTLGEGEFGKVKLGLHEEWGEEVAVKLIKRGSVDNQVRLSKVEREIEVLRGLKHPNIVRLYDVIETDKYIGIILEYASGGELFDHILAHRYLKERDACKLFAQLISGVWYIHQKKIVHRDLKLENLLLDRNRNVIITDFGFANRFEHRADDLMVTSCGSPCYAAPELVISEGAYVGSAVDVWSCGVILYAMLAGYLPFDDDPSNPDGDNINLLYKYIVSTTLTFPEYVSPAARALLGIMLVPDPARRATLEQVMSHDWLSAYAPLFQRSVEELEDLATEAAKQKREAYIRQAREARQALLIQQAHTQNRFARSQTAAVGHMPTLAAAAPAQQVGGGGRSGISGSATADFTLLEQHENVAGYHAAASPPPTSASSARRAVASAVVMPTSGPADEDELMEPNMPTYGYTGYGYTPQQQQQGEILPRTRKESAPAPAPSRGTGRAPQQQQQQQREAAPPPSASGSQKRRAASHRHTVQVEYDEPEAEPFPSSPPLPSSYQPQQHQPYPSAPQPHLTANNSIQQRPQRSRTSSDAASILLSNSQTGPTAPVLTTAHGQPQIIIPSGGPGGGGRVIESPGMPSQPLPQPPATPPSHHQQGRPKGAAAPQVVVSMTPKSPNVPRAPHPTPASPPKAVVPQPSYRRTATEPLLSLSGRYDEGGSGVESPVSPASATSSGHKALGEQPTASASTASSSRSGGGHRKTGSSAERMVGRESDEKMQYQQGGGSARGQGSHPPVSGAGRPALTGRASSGLGAGLSPVEQSEKEKKKSRRTTLSLMVGNAFSGNKDKDRSSRVVAPQTALPNLAPSRLAPGVSSGQPSVTPDYSIPPMANVNIRRDGGGPGPTASTGPAKQVMSWFRKKSLAKNGAPGLHSFDTTESGSTGAASNVTEKATPKLIITTTEPVEARYPSLSITTPTAAQPRPISSAPPPVLAAPGRFDASLLSVHNGSLDQGYVTTDSPPEVMRHVVATLDALGIEYVQETPYRYKCVRKKRPVSKKVGPGGMVHSSTGLGFAGVLQGGPSGPDRRSLLPVVSGAHPPSASGGMLKGLLRRGSSNAPPAPSPPLLSPALSDDSPNLGSDAADKLYGNSSVDKGDEVRFALELTRLEKLQDTYSLDMRRLKGGLSGYQFVYETIRDRLHLQ